MSVSCSRCGQTWPHDPAWEVECPTCGAKVGRPCRARRPSGFVHSAAYAAIPGGVHPDRDRLAMERVEGYGRCPGESARRPVTEQLTLFEGAA